MRIVSNNTKLLEEIYTDLVDKEIKVEQEDLKSDSSKGTPMGATCMTALNILNIAAAFATLQPYLFLRIKQFSNYIRFTKDKIEITLEEFDKMSPAGKEAILKEYDLLIKDK